MDTYPQLLRDWLDEHGISTIDHVVVEDDYGRTVVVVLHDVGGSSSYFRYRVHPDISSDDIEADVWRLAKRSIERLWQRDAR